MTALKVLSLHQPWATLVMLGVKRFETRPGPPTGDMRPEGVRAGIGGCALNRGDAIGIASTMREPDELVWEVPEVQKALFVDRLGVELKLGALLGTVRVVDAYPMVDAELGWTHDSDTPQTAVVVDTQRDHLTLLEHERELVIDSELPFGDWRPGRWAIELADPMQITEGCLECAGDPFHRADCWLCRGQRPCETVPVAGRQGVWELTPDRLRYPA